MISCCARPPDSEAQSVAAQAALDTLVLGSGELVVAGLALGNLEPNRQAWIERMPFEVRLRLPQ